MASLSTLHNAAMMGDLETVKRLVTRENINMTRPGPLNMIGVGLTPLAEASSFGHTDVVRFLLDSGARLDSHPSPLRLAGEGGFEDVVRMLIERGANVNETDGNQVWTMLHRMSYHGEVGVVKCLLENGADVNAKDGEDQTPLHLACDDGRLEVVKVLLNHGAKINEKGKDGATPLHLACARSVEIVKVLLEHRASLDEKDDDGLTPFAWANSTEITKTLSDHRAMEAKRRRRRRKKEKKRKQKNVEKNPEYVEGATSSEEMTRNPTESNNPFSSDLLLPDFMLDFAIMASLAIFSRRSSLTPLALACLFGYRYTMDNLLVSSASPQSQPSPLRLACDRQSTDTIRMLLENGANVNEAYEGGWTNLHSACNRGNLEVIEVLLQHGANIDKKTNDDQTPLHVACDADNLDVVKILLQHGAKVNAKGYRGATPLHIASSRGKEMVKLLLKYGASRDVKDEDDMTPLQVASNPEIVRILTEYKAETHKNTKKSKKRGKK